MGVCDDLWVSAGSWHLGARDGYFETATSAIMRTFEVFWLAT